MLAPASTKNTSETRSRSRPLRSSAAIVLAKLGGCRVGGDGVDLGEVRGQRRSKAGRKCSGLMLPRGGRPRRPSSRRAADCPAAGGVSDCGFSCDLSRLYGLDPAADFGEIAADSEASACPWLQGRRIVWLNVVTVLSAAVLISAEVFGAAFAGGWALANLFDLGDIGAALLDGCSCSAASP